ncbi:phage tail family protein [Streptomyces sp. ID05-39B]|uniref:phage distal tail protein n=1 Tax=Streptomyces sp. ID05-39B TaxID=3028664 RepID=UPI0029BB0E1E|nr:phage tail domain-containing protein [Streptomyces sp. ID05-39B]MDX3525072.1 phage tail family protein [Streptomyces sp. ID05-39B]
MPKLLLSSETDTLDLNEIMDKGLGYQAKTGVTGFGLPPVSVQWLEGAGDGATFRRRRVLTRDIDIPLEILARDRRHLQELTDRMALTLAGQCTLTLLDDDGTRWTTDVHRTGGGEYAYGVDTTGEREFQTVITFRAPDPYWTSSEAQIRSIGGTSAGAFLANLSSVAVSASQAIGEIQLDNRGNADAYPIWEITGPGRNFLAVSPANERLAWSGTLTANQRLIIDTRKGTVVDQDGDNRYAELDVAPRFWTVKPGLSTATAQLEDVSTASKITCSWRPRKWMVV